MIPETTRRPDPAVRVLAPAFQKYRVPLAGVERLATGGGWLEGPVWFGDGRYLLWSDIPNDRIMRWSETTGAVDVFREKANKANGNTRDRAGRLVTCEHGRRVTRTEYDGSVTVLADRFEGKRLNSPNDVVVASDGSVWFTDPSFGIESDFLGEIAERELLPSVYRIDGTSGEVTRVLDELAGPNGLAFSPDERILYVIDSKADPRVIRAYDVAAGGTLSNGRMLIDAGVGTPDGLRVDVDGNLWCGWGMGDADLDGVRVFTPQGEPIGHISLPERCANLCFGGPHRNRLFMASTTSVYALYVNTRGAAGG